MGTIESDHIDEFTRSLLGTGLWLFDLVADLAEELPEDAYPGEEPGAVVIDMLTGSIRTALASAEPERLLNAIDLIETSRERVIEHLELALQLSKRIHGGQDGQPRRAYG